MPSLCISYWSLVHRISVQVVRSNRATKHRGCFTFLCEDLCYGNTIWCARFSICTGIPYDLHRDSVNRRHLCDTEYHCEACGCYSATISGLPANAITLLEVAYKVRIFLKSDKRFDRFYSQPFIDGQRPYQ